MTCSCSNERCRTPTAAGPSHGRSKPPWIAEPLARFDAAMASPTGSASSPGSSRPPTGTTATATVYPVQDTSDPEERVWLCLATVADYVCTTHLASTSATVALAQCRYLLDTALPDLRRRDGDDPLVLGGDFNLRSGGSPGVQSCLPPGDPRADDGAVQHVVTSTGFRVRSTRLIGLHGTTDHPGLLVDLTITP